MSKTDSTKATSDFDPVVKEQQLRSESDSWDTSRVEEARVGDIPVIDLQPYFSRPGEAKLEAIARELRVACESVGFFSIVGHQVPQTLVASMFDYARKFHALALDEKQAVAMDRAGWPVGGIGYLPLKHRKLPARDKGNLNEAFIIKCDHKLTMDDNQWPREASLPGFRETVEHYAAALEALGKRLLPVFARALDMPPDFFADTTFCTILAQDRPGLTIFSERRRQWIKAPLLRNAFIVNTGELLRTWSNDRFISVKHFANNNTGSESRYSIPFFLNANSDYRMTCIPSCCGPDNPAKYPPISYAESQAVVQGE